MNTTEYILEYRFEAEDDWFLVETYEHHSDARYALVDHIQEFKHASCRIREVTEVRKIEERIVGEYTLGDES